MPCAHAFMCQPSFLPGSTSWENLSPCPSHRTMQVPAAAWSSPEILPPYLTLSCGGHMLSMGKERWLNSFMEATNKCSKNKELFVASWAVSLVLSTDSRIISGLHLFCCCLWVLHTQPRENRLHLQEEISFMLLRFYEHLWPQALIACMYTPLTLETGGYLTSQGIMTIVNNYFYVKNSMIRECRMKQ